MGFRLEFFGVDPDTDFRKFCSSYNIVTNCSGGESGACANRTETVPQVKLENPGLVKFLLKVLVILSENEGRKPPEY